MSKVLVALFITISMIVNAQVSFTSWTNSYMQVNSYNGNNNPDAYTVTFAANGNLNMPYWKLSAKLKQVITSTDGQYTIPGNKISFQPISSTGQAYPNPTPSLAQIGVPPMYFYKKMQKFFWFHNQMHQCTICPQRQTAIIIFSLNTELPSWEARIWELIRHGQGLQLP